MTEESLFHLVLQQDAAARAAFLAASCGGDAALRRRLEQLLNAHEHPAGILAQAAAAAPPLSDEVGSRLGPYRLLEQLGAGGMGVVFLAEQDEPVRRQVALKVIQPGLDSRHVLARFAVERQALALMDHPNIARVLDAGTSSAGRPYFVMELCRGVAITDYCELRYLSTPERLALFVMVCHAVQHAHLKGIIHRDLKPSNVLVLDGNADTGNADGCNAASGAVVKVIDFGIAKALGEEPAGQTSLTGGTQLLGTPMYMSPEQAELCGDVDTRSDVYALGVLLYELLTGVTPFDRERLRAASFDEVRHIIREEEPPRPSTRLSTLGQAASTQSAPRPREPRRLSRLMRGELDCIVMKALEKDRNRRYESASALAADVERYRRDEPVVARPPSVWYRLRKFARRRRAALALTAVVAAALVVALAGTAGSVGWALADRAARDSAVDEEADRILDTAAAHLAAGRWLEVRTGVDRAELLLQSAGRPVPSRLEQWHKDLQMVGQLDAVHDLLTTDQFSRLGVPGALGPRYAAAQAFAQAFRDYGLDLTGGASADVQAQLGACRIRLELARALDAWCGLRRGDTRPALPDAAQLVQLAKAADPDPVRGRLRDALQRGDRGELQAVAASAEVRQLSAATLLLLGRALDEVRSEQAVVLLRKAQAQYPDHLWINDFLGWLCVARQPRQPTEAVPYFTAALALRPTQWQTLCKRSFAYQQLRQLDKALDDITRATELQPKQVAVWKQLGFVQAQRGQWQLALAACNRGLALASDHAELYGIRGFVHANLGQWPPSIQDYSEAIRLGTGPNTGAFSSRARGRAVLGQWRPAAQDLQQALKVQAADAARWLDLAAYRAAAGEAAAHRQTCAELLRRFAPTRDAVVAHQIALAWFLVPRPAQELKVPTQLAAFSAAAAPNRPWCVLTHGAGLYRTGQLAAAVQLLDSLDKKWRQGPDPEGGRVAGWLLLALAQQRLGHGPEARRAFTRAGAAMDQEGKLPAPGRLRQEPPVWALCVLLRAEAEALRNQAK